MELSDLVRFTLRLAPLTPFAVGSGRTLTRFDCLFTVNPRSGTPLIRVLDTERFLEESPLPPEKKIEMIEKRTAGTLERFSRYILSASFRPEEGSLELREFQRDGEGKPQVPASSLKGLLRTAVLLAGARADSGAIHDGVEGAMEGRWVRERAAGRLERRLLGRTREIDLLRALRVGDPAPVSNEDLRAYEAAVLSPAGGPPVTKEIIRLEALNPRSDAAFDFPVRIDRRVLRAGDGSTGPAACRAALEGKEPLLAALRDLSQRVVEGEKRYYAETGARDLGRLFDETIRRAAGKIALPFGRGGGWSGKTAGTLLGPGELQRLEPLLSPGRRYYRSRGGVIHPKTRRWILERGRPVEPLGWVVIE